MTGNKKRPNLDVAVQEDFGVTGRTTLEKLDTYIRHCDAVIHLIGKATGAVPKEPAVAALLATYPDFGTRLTPLAAHLAKPQPGFSYTQWEAYLAIFHQRPLFARPRRKATRPPSKTSNRSTKPWPTAARRGCSRKRAQRYTATASSGEMRTTARGNSARSVPTWEPLPASSKPRGAASHPL